MVERITHVVRTNAAVRMTLTVALTLAGIWMVYALAPRFLDTE